MFFEGVDAVMKSTAGVGAYLFFPGSSTKWNDFVALAVIVASLALTVYGEKVAQRSKLKQQQDLWGQAANDLAESAEASRVQGSDGTDALLSGPASIVVGQDQPTALGRMCLTALDMHTPHEKVFGHSVFSFLPPDPTNGQPRSTTTPGRYDISNEPHRQGGDDRGQSIGMSRPRPQGQPPQPPHAGYGAVSPGN
jgi:hypothetical protein